MSEGVLAEKMYSHQAKQQKEGGNTMLVKICGLTQPEEAEYLNKNQVDLAGMVLFFPKSKRNISLDQAEQIMCALNPEIRKAAVTVSPDAEQVRQIEQAGFDYIQIHGELPEALLDEIKIPVLKAFNVKDMEQYEYYCGRPEIAGFVFDAQEPGSGQVFDWNLLKSLPKSDKLCILAGGLTPENVYDAVCQVQPDGVDVSSGVEKESGRGKDARKIQKFTENARRGDLDGSKL